MTEIDRMDMDIGRALALLGRSLDDIPRLRRLSCRNQEFPLWDERVRGILVEAFGRESNEYARYDGNLVLKRVETPEEMQQAYVDHLCQREAALKDIVQRCSSMVGVRVEGPSMLPKAFIAHGGDSAALTKLKDFLCALGVDPLVVEDQASEDRSANENVEHYLSRAHCAIVLAAKGDIDGKTGNFLPRGNVLVEAGRFQERFAGRVVYLLEEGATLPSNLREKVWGEFTQDNMERAFIKIVKELRAFGIIVARTPAGKGGISAATQ